MYSKLRPWRSCEHRSGTLWMVHGLPHQRLQQTHMVHTKCEASSDDSPPFTEHVVGLEDLVAVHCEITSVLAINPSARSISTHSTPSRTYRDPRTPSQPSPPRPRPLSSASSAAARPRSRSGRSSLLRRPIARPATVHVLASQLVLAPTSSSTVGMWGRGSVPPHYASKTDQRSLPPPVAPRE